MVIGHDILVKILNIRWEPVYMGLLDLWSVKRQTSYYFRRRRHNFILNAYWCKQS